LTVFFSEFILVLLIFVVALLVAVIGGSVAGSVVDKASTFLAQSPGEVEAREAAARVPSKPLDKRLLAARQRAYRQGIAVLIALAALTAIEFILAKSSGGSPVLLFVVALVKAGLIVQYYMHLQQVWGEEEGHR
jgi:hypothetical protein